MGKKVFLMSGPTLDLSSMNNDTNIFIPNTGFIFFWGGGGGGGVSKEVSSNILNSVTILKAS